MVRTLSTASARDVKKRLNLKAARIQNLLMDSQYSELKSEAGRVVKLACDYGLYNVAVICYDALVKYYTFAEPSSYWVNDFKQKRDCYLQLQQEDENARAFYHEFAAMFDRSRKIKEETKRKASRYAEDIRQYEKSKNHGPFFYMRFYHMLAMERDLWGDQVSRLEIAEEAHKYYDDHELFLPNGSFSFLNVIVDSLISLNRWSDCRKYLQIKDVMQASPNDVMRANHASQQRRVDLYYGIETEAYFQVSDNNINRGQYDYSFLLDIYRLVLKGEFVDRRMFKRLASYKYDPTGFGLALNIARLLDAYNRETLVDLKDTMRSFKNDHLKDTARGRAMIDMILSRKLGDLPGAYNANEEVVLPYDKIILLLSSRKT